MAKWWSCCWSRSVQNMCCWSDHSISSDWLSMERFGVRLPRFGSECHWTIQQTTQPQLHVDYTLSMVFFKHIFKWVYFSQLHTRIRSGIRYTTFTCEATYLLPYLYERIQNAGGHIERKRIESFDELHAFDLAINCTGLGAQVLVENDVELRPIRGQVMRVKAPWINEVLFNDKITLSQSKRAKKTRRAHPKCL